MNAHDKTMTTLETINASEPALLTHDVLDQVAEAALSAARLLMETGAPATVVHEECARIARALGAEHIDLQSGFGSLDITLTSGMNRITRVVQVGPLGVNYRLCHAIRKTAQRISRNAIAPEEAVEEINGLKLLTGHHHPLVVATAVGIACAAFGRLLGMDWPAFIPVGASATIGQWIRYWAVRRGYNVFAVTCVIAFLTSTLAAIGARLAGSTNLNLAMVASVLLLVPGVPAVDGQDDILEGHPTLGTARVVVVSCILIFIATGVLLARSLVGVR